MNASDTTITIGLESCAAKAASVLDGSRFGLLMNRASVDRELRLACDVLNTSYPAQLAAIFTPQHGLWGDAQANMVESPHGWHADLDVPVYSLYAKTRRPAPQMLSDLDWLVIDLQDVGTRVYTYAWTMLECLYACEEADVGVLVLDRPNPLGGAVEGPSLDIDFRSFVGGASIPMRHGLTMAELARLLNDELGIGVQLDVLPVRGWSKSQLFPELERHWLAPSPNLPTFESALVYPGQVLLEGTNLSEGRGTTIPFQVVGAPFVDATRLCDTLQSLDLPGVKFLPIQFRPTFDKWADQCCGGVSLHVVDSESFRPYRTTLAILAAVRTFWPSDFSWSSPPYEYETLKPPIDILSGGATLRTCIDDMTSLDVSQLDALAATDRDWQARATAAKLYE